MFANDIHKDAHETLKSGKIEEAITLYNLALVKNPGHPDILSDRGVAYLHLENQEMCFQDLMTALEIEPEKAYRYASFAYARNHFGDIDGAIADYQKAIELDPDDAVAHNNLGLLLEQKGYEAEAKEKFERADKLSKMEDELLQMMDKLEGNPTANYDIANATGQNVKEEKQSVMKEMKKILTSRQQFREFMQFVKNGFKLK